MKSRKPTGDHEARVTARARQIWEEKGRPAAGPDAYRDMARELVAIEENFETALKPVEPTGPYGEPIEPIEAVENEGEFPTLTDQGEEEAAPHRKPRGT